ncbi:MAG: 3-hydroxyacyl-CoA dehydrogenase NAD-binding domain-containing protein [Candidatus Bathyarchaeia archaeon]
MQIKKVTCVGGGLVGASWALLFALKGYPVTLQSRRKETIEKAVNDVKSNLSFLEEKGLINSKGKEAVLRRIKTTYDLSDAVKDADYIQESVAEDLELKRNVFSQIDAAARPDAIIASSSSALIISDIQVATTKPERCVIVHPYNPVHLIPLVEIVPGKKTSPETVKIAHDFMLRLGKVPVVAKKEVPGHIVNRLAHVLFREVADSVEKGIATVGDIDKAFTASLGIRWAIMGPFLTYHLGGGPGGIDEFFEKYRMGLSASVVEKIIRGVKEEEIVRTRSMDELIRWRDEKLIELLKILYPDVIKSLSDSCL